MDGALTSPPAAEAAPALPAGLAECHELLRQQHSLIRQRDALIHEQHQGLIELAHQKQSLQQQLDRLLRRLYGRRSERMDVAQLFLFGKEMAAAEAAPAPTQRQGEGSEPRRRGRPHGRRPLPAHLPRHRLVHPIAPEDLTCPCGCTRRRIGEEVTEQLDYQPSSLFVLQHVRPKFACPNPNCTQGPGVVIADKPPQPIDKGLAGPGLIAHVITSKYADHQPLYRQEGILARQGVDLDRSTLGDWIERVADLLMPLYVVMVSFILRSRIIKTDDTTVPVQQGKGKTCTGRLWGYIGDREHPYNAFDYSPDHCGHWPQKFLAGFCGFLQADAYSGYHAVFAEGKVVEVGCMAHGRRKFIDAKDSDPVPAHQALAFIRQLYAVEDKAKDMDDAGRLALRQAESVPVLNQMHAWLLEQQKHALPKSLVGQAVGYFLNHWDALCRYTTDGSLSIDNNESERLMKLVALGRNNWLFAGSHKGGKRAAVLYSFVATCKRHGVDPEAWFTDVLTRIMTTPISQLAQFLPDRWKAAGNDVRMIQRAQQRPPPPQLPAG
jgi:transposase